MKHLYNTEVVVHSMKDAITIQMIDNSRTLFWTIVGIDKWNNLKELKDDYYYSSYEYHEAKTY